MQILNKEEYLKKAFIIQSIWNTTSFLVASLFSKILTFVFTMLLIRIIDKEAFGIAKIYLEFIYHILMFVPRETIRRSCQKYSSNTDPNEEMNRYRESCQLNWILVISLMFLSFPIYFLMVTYVEALNNHRLHLGLYISSAILELTMEPVVMFMNLKLENYNRLVALTFPNYVRVITNFFYAYYYELQIWSFTLSRITASLFSFSFLLFLGKFKYMIGSFLIPKYEYFFKLTFELKIIFFSFFKNSFLKMILLNTEKIFLSLILNFSEIIKAEYGFVIDNFYILSKFLVEPLEDNFFNLISKLKTYKCNQVNEKLGKYSKYNDDKLKILMATLRIMLIFSFMLYMYISIIGKELITFLYTETWATNSTIKLTKYYSIYLGMLAVTGIVESYANAVMNEKTMKSFRQNLFLNSITLVSFSYYLSKFDISGLIFANIFCLILRVLVALYLIVIVSSNEEFNIFNDSKDSFIMKDLVEVLKFIYLSFFKISTASSIVISVIILKISKNFDFFKESLLFFLIFVCLISLVNLAFIVKFERKRFKEIISLRNTENFSI